MVVDVDREFAAIADEPEACVDVGREVVRKTPRGLELDFHSLPVLVYELIALAAAIPFGSVIERCLDILTIREEVHSE